MPNFQKKLLRNQVDVCRLTLMRTIIMVIRCNNYIFTPIKLVACVTFVHTSGEKTLRWALTYKHETWLIINKVDFTNFQYYFKMCILNHQANIIYDDYYNIIYISVVPLIRVDIPPCFCPSNACWQGSVEQRSRFSLCLFVSLSPSLSLMCQLSRARAGQAAMSISSIHQAVGRVAERG